jgi:hypothetical protein
MFYLIRSFATRVSQLKIWHYWVIGIERNVCRCTFNRYCVMTQFAKLAAGEQLCRRCPHRKLLHFKTFKSFSWKITHFELWHLSHLWPWWWPHDVETCSWVNHYFINLCFMFCLFTDCLCSNTPRCVSLKLATEVQKCNFSCYFMFVQRGLFFRLWEEHGLRVVENRALIRIFGPKAEKGTWWWEIYVARGFMSFIPHQILLGWSH